MAALRQSLSVTFVNSSTSSGMAIATTYRRRSYALPRRLLIRQFLFCSNQTPKEITIMSFQGITRWASAVVLLAACAIGPARAADTIKVGVLHSLSGTMAISETVLKDVTLMAIDEVNAKGGVLGKKLEPVVVDPASNWPLFAEKARQLLTQDKVAVVFG